MAPVNPPSKSSGGLHQANAWQLIVPLEAIAYYPIKIHQIYPEGKQSLPNSLTHTALLASSLAKCY
jgi:hypothetical protein